MADTVMKWYVLRAVTGQETKVKEYIEAEMKHDPILGNHVAQLLVPTEKRTSLRNGKRVVSDKNYLPGYILVQAHLEGEVAHKLRFMPNVLGFLGGLDHPSPIKQSELNKMLGNAEETEIKGEDVNIPYCVDDVIKVTDGPFNGFTGVIEEVNNEKRKLKVMVKIFGRKTPLELGFTQVEKE